MSKRETMGQYHKVVNFDRKEYIHPHRFGDGLKLLEFGCSKDGTLTGLAILLAASNDRGGGDLHVSDDASDVVRAVVGRWAGNRIAIVGDYHEPADVPGQTLPKDFWGQLYEERNGWCDISHAVIAAMEEDGYIREARHRPNDGGRSRADGIGTSDSVLHMPTYDAQTDTFRPAPATRRGTSIGM